MISSHHGLFDDRIYWKEALSLKNAGYEVHHLAVGTEEKEETSVEGIHLRQVKKKMYVKNPYIDKLYRLIFFRPKVYSLLYKEASRIQADIYHIHDFQVLRIVKKVKSLAHRPKIIYDVHEPYPVTIAHSYASNVVVKIIQKIYGAYIGRWEMKKSGYADYIIATEENVCDRFRKIYGESKTGIIYNYCDFKIPPARNIPKEYDLIYTGSIRKNRGAYTIIKVTALLKEKFPGIKTLLIGNIYDAAVDRKIKALIEKYRVKKHVLIKPFTPYEKMPEIYATSKIGLILFDDNPIYRIIMPIKLFEYMTFGLPVISSDVGHPGRITRKHDTGVTVNPKNGYEIAHKISTLLEDEKLYNKLSRNAREKAVQEFRWELMEEKLKGMYEGILES